MFREIVLTAIVLVVSSAPLVPKDDQGTVGIRAKRSEEAIIYGNHQNMARIKKADLHPKPFLSQQSAPATDADKKTSTGIETEGVPIEIEAQQTPEVPSSTKPEDPAAEQLHDDVNAGIANLVAPHDNTEGDMTEDEEKEIEKLLRPDDADNIDVEEKNLERLLSEEKGSDDLDEETLNELKNEEFSLGKPSDIIEEYQNVEEDTSGDGEMLDLPGNDVFRPRGEYYDDEGYWGDSYRPLNSAYGAEPSRFLSALREKRSATKNRESGSFPKAINAEDMNFMSDAAKNLGGRVKRDLAVSPEELQAIIESNYFDPDESYNEVERRGAPSENWSNDDMEDLLKDEIARYDVDPRSYEAGYMPREDDDASLDYDDQVDLALLRYLYGEGGDGPELQELDYPNDVKETWENLGPAQEVLYEPPPYEPESEFELPDKRQYMSFVPGVRKRTPDFYPYQYGPDSRWGAFVLQPELEKRNEFAEYQKLFELAEALNGPESDTELEKRQGGGYPREDEYEYWPERRK